MGGEGKGREWVNWERGSFLNFEKKLGWVGLG